MAARDYRVDADVARAETLPPAAFTDPAFLDLELATVFRRRWVFVPQRSADMLREDERSLADLVRRRGARCPISVLDRPLFLQRDWTGTLRAFPNVCTHAWHTLVQGPGRERTLTCPQHGRKFEADGRYVSQPGFENAPGVPRQADHLQAFPVDAWGDFPFLAFETPAQALDELLQPVQASLGHLSVADLARKPMPGEIRDVDGNWKQHAWNYMDQLHIPFIHRQPGGLADALDAASYRTELHGDAALQWACARRAEHGFEPDALPTRFRRGDQRVFALWWFVFPNLALNVYPWGLSINAWMPIPGQPQRTRFHWYQYAWDEAKYAERERVWMMREVDAEDVDALTQVARGVRSGLAPRGRFAPRGEEGPHWFHRRVYEAVFGAASPRGRNGARRARASR